MCPSSRIGAEKDGRSGGGVPSTVRVLVVEPDPLARSAIRSGLEAGDGVEVVAECWAPAAAVETAETVDPDVVLLGSGTGPSGSVRLTREICAASPGCRVVVLAERDHERLALAGLRAGAIGFLPRDVSVSALPRIARGVADGEAAVTRSLTAAIARRVREGSEQGGGGRLNEHELEIVEMLAGGATLTGIATRLRVPPEAARRQLRRVIHKLGARTRTEAVDVARRLGLGAPGDGASRPRGERAHGGRVRPPREGARPAPAGPRHP